MTRAALTIDINARLANLEQSLKSTEQLTKNLATNIEGFGRGLLQFSSAAIGIASVADGLRALVRSADEFTRIGSQIRLVTDSIGQAVQTQTALFKIAQETRQAFGDLAGTYTSVARSSGDLGVSQEELLRLTETISKAVQIGGGAAQSTNAALVQFGQGMVSGTLRGAELNSVLEQTPRLAKALADGLGVGIGGLRKLAEQGQLTSQEVVAALRKAAQDIDKEFLRITPTVESSFAVFTNSAKAFASRLDEILGLTKAVGAALRGAASGLDAFTAGGSAARVDSARASGLQSQLEVAQTRRQVLPEDSPVAKRLDAQIASYKQQIEALRIAAAASEQRFGAAVKKGSSAVSGNAQEVLQRLGGNSQRFNGDLAALFAEYEKGNLSLEEYRSNVEKLIAAETSLGKQRQANKRVSTVDESKRLADDAERAVESLKEQNALLFAQSETEKILFAVQRGRYANLNEGAKADLLLLAEQIDLQKKNNVEAEQERQLWEAGAQAQRDATTELFKYSEQLKDSFDPARKLRAEIEKITELEAKGFGSGASTQRRQELELEIAAQTGPQLPKDLLKQTDKLKQSAQDLGFVFKSAFEDAIVGGKRFSDVLKGLAQDILKVVIRRTITEPLGNAISGLFGPSPPGASPPGRAIGGPVGAGRPYIVGERGPELFIPNTAGNIKSSAGGITFAPVYQIQGGDKAGVMAAIQSTRQQTIADLRDMQRRGQF